MLTITEQILFAIKNSSKMLIYVNTLVKKKTKTKQKNKKNKQTIEHKTFYIKR